MEFVLWEIFLLIQSSFKDTYIKDEYMGVAGWLS